LSTDLPTTDATPPIAAAVVVHEGRVLLVRRAVPEGALVWQFPAGKIEPGESAEDAAERETREETGLVVAAQTLLGERVHPATGRAMRYVACDVVIGEARAMAAREVSAVAWPTAREFAAYVPHPLHGPVRDYLRAAMGDSGCCIN
jgi:8-oxo-dGTP diphosphatase